MKQLENPDSQIVLESQGTGRLLSKYAASFQGLKTGDDFRYRRCFWEVAEIGQRWRVFQSTVEATVPYGGLESVVDWHQDGQNMARLQGMGAWSRRGVAVKLMGKLPCALYSGDIFDSNIAPIIPRDPAHLPAIWAFCESGELSVAVRHINQKLNVAEGTIVNVPFDLEHWQKVADENESLPEPYSDDPAQWLFQGDITRSTDPLQVAVARMLGHRWSEQPKERDKIDALADEDGIVCVPAVRGEKPAAERLLEILQAAYGTGKMPVPPQEQIQAGNGGTGFQPVQGEDSTAKMAVPPIEKLLTNAGCKPGTSLDEWLREKFFEQHCKRFHNRPFIWHIWDGRKDGFSCLVNYHKLNHKRLEMLTYSYLQDWITAQAAAAKDGKPGADLRLVAAQELQNKLKLILAGEPPYDIFVRWKPIEEQPIGWNPDLNDGVRINIRPFMTAEVLRKKPSIQWSKDRGKEPERDQEQYPWFWKDGKFTGDRINDYHLTNAQKRVAQAA